MSLINNIFVELRCAFDSSNFFNPSWVSHGESRDSQYERGFKTFFDVYAKYNIPYKNIYVVDNTLKSKEDLNKNIANNIPKDVNLTLTQKNKYGRRNKGAGDIEGWNFTRNIFSKYKYFFHHEPRMETKSSVLFDTFLKEPNNIFIINNEPDQFQTGTFIIRTEDMLDYIDYRTPQQLCSPPTNIENDLFNFINKVKKTDFTTVSKVGIMWTDSATGRVYEL